MCLACLLLLSKKNVGGQPGVFPYLSEIIELQVANVNCRFNPFFLLASFQMSVIFTYQDGNIRK